MANVVTAKSTMVIVQNFVAFSEYMNFNLCTSIFWESNWPRIIYLQYCTLLLSPCTELEVIVPMIWEFSLKSRLGVSFRVIISVFCLFFSRPLNAYPMSIFVDNLGTYRTRAIITRGLYTFYPLFEVQKRFFKGLFS